MSTSIRTTGRVRAGAILIYLLSVLLTGSAAVKFAHVPQPTSELAELGFGGGNLTLIAVLEVSSAVLFALPRTRSFGLLLVSAYLGGAIATHVGHHQLLPSFRPAIVLALIWLAAWLRHPEMLWSIAGKSVETA
jgi:hypothetical protein